MSWSDPQPGFAAIHYCNSCGRRITREQFAAGDVIERDGKKVHRSCPGAPAAAPVAEEPDSNPVAVADTRQDLPPDPLPAAPAPARRRTTSSRHVAQAPRKTPAGGQRSFAARDGAPPESHRLANRPHGDDSSGGRKLLLAGVVVLILGLLATALGLMHTPEADPPPEAHPGPPKSTPVARTGLPPAPATAAVSSSPLAPAPAVPPPITSTPPANSSPPTVAPLPAPTSAPAGPPVAALNQLQPGHWFEAPSTHLESVFPNPHPPGSPRAIMGAWNGAAFDTKRNRLLVWGGGNTNYGGNEIYAFDIATLQWNIVWGPTPVDQIPTGKDNYETYPDGNPGSRATKDGLVYLPGIDALFANGSGLWFKGGTAQKVWRFDFGPAKWSVCFDNPDDGFGVNSAFDPNSGHVFFQANQKFYEYDPVAGGLTPRGSFNGGLWNGKMTAAIDPLHKRYVFVGGKKCYSYDLTTWERTEPATTGDQTIVNGNSPGFEYVPTLKKFVAWEGGTDLYLLDPETWAWTKTASAADNQIVPGAICKNGTFGRFRYVASNDCFVLVNAADQNVFFAKLSAAKP